MIGSRAQVMHGTATKTSGGLTQKDLKYNKHGRIVSKKVSVLAKKNNRLVKAGYITKKGKFGVKLRGGGGSVSIPVKLKSKSKSKSKSKFKSKFKSKSKSKSNVDLPNIPITFNNASAVVSRLNTAPKNNSLSSLHKSNVKSVSKNKTSYSFRSKISLKDQIENSTSIIDKFDIFVNSNMTELNNLNLINKKITRVSGGTYGDIYKISKNNSSNNELYAIKIFKNNSDKQEEINLYNNIKLSSLNIIIYNILPIYKTNITLNSEFKYSLIMPLCNGNLKEYINNIISTKKYYENTYLIIKQIIYIIHTLAVNNKYYTDFKLENLLYILHDNGTKLRIVIGDIGSFNGKVSTYHSFWRAEGVVVYNGNNKKYGTSIIQNYQKFEIGWAIYNMILYIYDHNYRYIIKKTHKFKWGNERYNEKYQDYLKYNTKIKRSKHINPKIIQIIEIFDEILERIISIKNNVLRNDVKYGYHYMQEFSDTLDKMYNITHIDSDVFNQDIILS